MRTSQQGRVVSRQQTTFCGASYENRISLQHLGFGVVDCLAANPRYNDLFYWLTNKINIMLYLFQQVLAALYPVLSVVHQSQQRER